MAMHYDRPLRAGVKAGRLMVDWCEDGNHMWIVPGEGADPHDYEMCLCGALSYRDARANHTFGRPSPPVKTPAPVAAPGGAPQ